MGVKVRCLGDFSCLFLAKLFKTLATIAFERLQMTFTHEFPTFLIYQKIARNCASSNLEKFLNILKFPKTQPLVTVSSHLCPVALSSKKMLKSKH